VRFWQKCCLMLVLLIAAVMPLEGWGQQKIDPRDSALFAEMNKEKPDFKQVKALLDKGASPNTQRDTLTVLMMAAVGGNESICRLLLERGANVQVKDNDDLTALEYAYRSGSLPLVKFLLSKGAKVRPERPDLLAAVANGSEELTRWMLEQGYNPNVKELLTGSALAYAVKENDAAIFALLLDKGADPNLADEDGVTPLMLAAQESHLAMVQTLIQRKADVNARDKTYKTPLLYAAGGSKAAIIAALKKAGAKDIAPNVLSATLQNNALQLQELLNAGADPNLFDDAGRTPLHHAAENSQAEFIPLLLAKGANPNAKDKTGETPLTLIFKRGSGLAGGIMDQLRDAGAESPEVDLFDAIRANDLTAVKALLDQGVNVNTKNGAGSTLLSFALEQEERRWDIVRLLVERKADVNLTDNAGFAPLHHAVTKGTVEQVAFLLDNGANVNAAKSDGWSVLMAVSGESYDALVRLLIERGADARAKLDTGKTVLMVAVGDASLETLRLLLDKGADINAETDDGETVLDFAIPTGDAATVRLFLEHGSNPDTQNHITGSTPLIILMMHLREYREEEAAELVRLLLAKGAKVDARDKQGFTAMRLAQDQRRTKIVTLLKQAGGTPTRRSDAEELAQAIDAGSVERVRQLLAKGVDPNTILPSVFDTQWTALTTAAGRGETEIVRVLLDQGADPNQRGDNEGALPLHNAAEAGDEEIVRLLLKHGAKPDALVFGDTALIEACIKGHVGTVRILLANGANPRVKSSSGLSVLSAASRSGSVELIRLLLAKGANVNDPDSSGSTALHETAAFRSSTDLLTLLLDKGAKPNAQDKLGNTPLHAAASFGNVPAVRVLLARGAKPNIQNNKNQTALAAAHNGLAGGANKQELIRVLKAAGGK
jgi:ankyrin repeat protein